MPGVQRAAEPPAGLEVEQADRIRLAFVDQRVDDRLLEALHAHQNRAVRLLVQHAERPAAQPGAAEHVAVQRGRHALVVAELQRQRVEAQQALADFVRVQAAFLPVLHTFVERVHRVAAAHDAVEADLAAVRPLHVAQPLHVQRRIDGRHAGARQVVLVLLHGAGDQNRIAGLREAQQPRPGLLLQAACRGHDIQLSARRRIMLERVLERDDKVLLQRVAEDLDRRADAFLRERLVAGEVARRRMHDDDGAVHGVAAAHVRRHALLRRRKPAAAVHAGRFGAVGAADAERVLADLRQIGVVFPLPLHPVAERVEQLALEHGADLLRTQALEAAVVLHLVHAELLPAADAVRHLVQHELRKDDAVFLPLVPVHGIDVAGKVLVLLAGDADALIAAHQHDHVRRIGPAQLADAAAPAAVALAGEAEEVGRHRVELVHRRAVVGAEKGLVAGQRDFLKIRIPHRALPPAGAQRGDVAAVAAAQPGAPVFQLRRVVGRAAGRPRAAQRIRRLVDDVHLHIRIRGERLEKVREHAEALAAGFRIVQRALLGVPVVHLDVAEHELHREPMLQRRVEKRLQSADAARRDLALRAVKRERIAPHARADQVEAVLVQPAHIPVAQPGVHVHEAAAVGVGHEIGRAVHRRRLAALHVELRGDACVDLHAWESVVCARDRRFREHVEARRHRLAVYGAVDAVGALRAGREHDLHGLAAGGRNRLFHDGRPRLRLIGRCGCNPQMDLGGRRRRTARAPHRDVNRRRLARQIPRIGGLGIDKAVVFGLLADQRPERLLRLRVRPERAGREVEVQHAARVGADGLDHSLRLHAPPRIHERNRRHDAPADVQRRLGHGLFGRCIPPEVVVGAAPVARVAAARENRRQRRIARRRRLHAAGRTLHLQRDVQVHAADRPQQVHLLRENFRRAAAHPVRDRQRIGREVDHQAAGAVEIREHTGRALLEIPAHRVDDDVGPVERRDSPVRVHIFDRQIRRRRRARPEPRDFRPDPAGQNNCFFHRIKPPNRLHSACPPPASAFPGRAGRRAPRPP